MLSVALLSGTIYIMHIQILCNHHSQTPTELIIKLYIILCCNIGRQLLSDTDLMLHRYPHFIKENIKSDKMQKNRYQFICLFHIRMNIIHIDDCNSHKIAFSFPWVS